MPGRSESSRALRAAAGITVLLGLLLLNELPGLSGQAGYLGVLSGLGAGIALLSGMRLWFSGCCIARTLAVSVAVSSLGALLLDRLVGLPGSSGPDRSSDLTLAAVLLIACGVVALLVIDTRVRAVRPSQSSPYALLP